MSKKNTRPVIQAAVCSDKGRRRANNEDNFCLNGLFMQREEMDRGGLYETRSDGDALFAVCDGMGGEEAGEEASLLSVQLCARYLEDGKMSAERKKLEAFFLDSCISVMRQAQHNENRSGSTVAMLIADENGLHPANMGDSRIYRFHGGQLQQISEDHTEVQRLLEKGAITPREVKTHPKRHMIRQYWGMPLSVAPFSPYFGDKIPYDEGDKYLLCSDGLTDMLDDAQIEALIRQDKPAAQLCRELVDEALRHGGRDNVTVLIARIEESSRQEGDKTGEKGWKNWFKRLLFKEAKDEKGSDA